MKEFNYWRAWVLLAYPKYQALPVEVRDLLDQTKDVGQPQKANLDCAWPLSVAFRQAFEGMEPETLCKSARILWCLGHWWNASKATDMLYCKDVDYLNGLSRNGAFWRFSNYADQVLREKVAEVTGLQASKEKDFKVREVGKGSLGFGVIEGAIRVYGASHTWWIWKEVCWATPTKAKAVKDFLEWAVPEGTTPRQWEDHFSELIAEARKRFMDPELLEFLEATTRFATEEQKAHG